MMNECKKMFVPTEPCLAATEFLDKEYKEENVEIIAWMTVKGTYQNTEHVKFKTLPAVKVASCVIKGGYEQMNDAIATIASWINANGYKVSAYLLYQSKRSAKRLILANPILPTVENDSLSAVSFAMPVLIPMESFPQRSGGNLSIGNIFSKNLF